MRNRKPIVGIIGQSGRQRFRLLILLYCGWMRRLDSWEVTDEPSHVGTKRQGQMNGSSKGPRFPIAESKERREVGGTECALSVSRLCRWGGKPYRSRY